MAIGNVLGVIKKPVFLEVTQASHGFDNSFIVHNGTTWVKAQADSTDTCATHFAIREDDNNFVAYLSGEVDVTGLTDDAAAALVAGEYYYLSQTVSGKVTATAPSTGAAQSVMKMSSATKASIIIDIPVENAGAVVYTTNANTFSEIQSYDTHPTFSADTSIVDKKYVDDKTHNSLVSLQGGTTNEYYHLTSAQHTDLTDGGDSTLHYHSADRLHNDNTDLQGGSSTERYHLTSAQHAIATQAASASVAGYVTTSAQTFEGEKDFISGRLVVSGSTVPVFGTNTTNAAVVISSNNGLVAPYIALHSAGYTGVGGQVHIVSTSEVRIEAAYNTTVTGRDLVVSSVGAIGYVSSIRASKNNISYSPDISWLYTLQPASFEYRLKDEDGNYLEETDGIRHVGLIAEDVNPIRPEMVYKDIVDGEEELRGVDYKYLITPLLQAVKELKQENQELKARIAALENT